MSGVVETTVFLLWCGACFPTKYLLCGVIVLATPQNFQHSEKGTQESLGREFYGRQEKRWWETRYLLGQELGEILHNIVQFFVIKMHTEPGTTKEGGENREYKLREGGNSGSLASPSPVKMFCSIRQPTPGPVSS